MAKNLNYIGTKLYKNNPEDMAKYTTIAIWCNANKATIEDKGEYYECVAIAGPTLAEAKASKMAELTARWNAEDEMPVTVAKGEFECDTLSRNRISVAVSAMADGDKREWTLKNGTTVELTKAELQGVLNAWINRCDTYHTKFMGLKAQVDSATTVAQVEAISWDEK